MNFFRDKNDAAPMHQISWASDWVIEYAIFLRGLAQQWRLWKKQNLAQK